MSLTTSNIWASETSKGTPCEQILCEPITFGHSRLGKIKNYRCQEASFFAATDLKRYEGFIAHPI